MRSQDPFADPERLIRRVYAYVAYRIGEGADAEDVTAEAIERALRYRDSFDEAKGEAAAWVIGIARRVIATRAVNESAVPSASPPGATEDLEERMVRHMSVRAAVARLSERERELVALRYGADLTAREIAELLELKTNAVEVALHRAIARLRDDLELGPRVRARPVAQAAPD